MVARIMSKKCYGGLNIGGYHMHAYRMLLMAIVSKNRQIYSLPVFCLLQYTVMIQAK